VFKVVDPEMMSGSFDEDDSCIVVTVTVCSYEAEL